MTDSFLTGTHKRFGVDIKTKKNDSQGHIRVYNEMQGRRRTDCRSSKKASGGKKREQGSRTPRSYKLQEIILGLITCESKIPGIRTILFGSFEHSDLGFVSNFDIRISDLSSIFGLVRTRAMKGKINLDAVSIVLVRPRFPENVGSVARAMKNMGLSHLILVDGCSPLHMNAYKLASGAEDILERAEEVPSLWEAISEMGVVIGTTSRAGKERSPLLTPEKLIKDLLPLSVKNSIGLVFGPEREGLTNEELSLCHLYVRIPAAESFASLNLAQAVMILCYELFRASGSIPKRPIELAHADQLEKMLEHMERTLLAIGFLGPKNPRHIMRTLRRLFGKSRLEEREVRILQGIWSQMDWRLGKHRIPGTKSQIRIRMTKTRNPKQID